MSRVPAVTSWLTSVIARAGAALRPASRPIDTWVPGWTSGTADLASVSDTRVVGIPAVGRALGLYGSTLAQGVPTLMGPDPDGTWRPLDQQPTWLTDPTPLVTADRWRWSLAHDVVLYGNAFARLVMTDGALAQVAPLDPRLVGLVTDGESVWWTHNAEPVGWDLMLHVSAGNRGGEVLGRGLIGQYPTMLGLADRRMAESASFYAPSGVLTHPDPHLPAADRDAIKAALRAALAGRREPLVLPSGATWTPVTANATEAQLRELSEWDARQLLMATGVPAYLAGGIPGDRSVYTNAESEGLSFLRWSAGDLIVAVESALTRVATGPYGRRPDTRVRMQWSDFLALDQASLTAVLVAQIGAGLRTVDEGRQALRLPALDGRGTITTGVNADAQTA